ncbi:MAG TPA: hypothetical protein VFK57_13290 [Vicinamibacterales bacterium]|nr:hypothetical protein [Vicinamibacterales bacterium]
MTASARRAAATRRQTRRFAPLLLLALPFVVALAPDLAEATRAIHVRVSQVLSVVTPRS